MNKILNDIRESHFERVYLLYGDNALERQSAKQRLMQALSGDDELNTIRCGKESLSPVTLKEFTDTMPLFGERRTVLVENSLLFSGASQEYVNWIRTLPETAVVVFNEDGYDAKDGERYEHHSGVDKRNALFKAVSECGYAAEFTEPDEKKRGAMILKAAKNADLKIRENAYYRLLEILPDDGIALWNELKKLTDYCATTGEITLQDVETVVTPKIEDRVYVMAEEAAKGNRKKALELYYDLVALKTPYPQILNILTRHVMEIAEAKELASDGVRDKEAASIMGKRDFVIPKLMREGSGRTRDEVRALAEYAVDLGCAFRHGEMSDRTAVELLLFRMSEPAKPRRV